jgi:ribonuclease I
MLPPWISRVLGSLGLLVLAAAIPVATAATASAQDRRQNTPGEFDYYVLSLSWSPSFCEEAVAAARPQHRVVDAGPDAGARADLQ